MKRILKLVFIAVAAASCGKNDKPAPTPTLPVVEGLYKTGSFNIRYYNDIDGEYSWEKRLPAVIRFFSDEHPDIIGLQEIRRPQVEDIQAIAGYDSYIIFRDNGSSSPYNDEDEGNGIMWDSERFTLADKGFFWLAPDPDSKPKWQNGSYPWGTTIRRIAVYVKLLDKKDNDMPVYFYATHFDHQKKDARTAEAGVLLSRIKNYLFAEDLSTLVNRLYVVGDLNCTDSEAAYTTLASELKCARKTSSNTSIVATFNDFGRGGTAIDHIFYAGPVKPLSFRVISKDYGIKYISDHYPVLFESN